MWSYEDYWSSNTFEMNKRVLRLKQALKTSVADDVRYTRIGSTNDGGYVLADDVQSVDHVVSFGVETNVDFEKELSELGCSIDMYDYSVDGPPENIPNSTFSKSKIGLVSDGDTSLAGCLEKTNKDTILKIDIEGSEWKVLAAGDYDLGQCRQIAVEYHWTHQITDQEFYTTAVAAVENVRRTHTPVMVHANNNVPLMIIGNSPVPMVFEVLYLRTSSYTFKVEHDPFEGIITRNDSNFPEIGLSFP